jgi:hypothetical protein
MPTGDGPILAVVPPLHHTGGEGALVVSDPLSVCPSARYCLFYEKTSLFQAVCLIADAKRNGFLDFGLPSCDFVDLETRSVIISFTNSTCSMYTFTKLQRP